LIINNQQLTINNHSPQLPLEINNQIPDSEDKEKEQSEGEEVDRLVDALELHSGDLGIDIDLLAELIEEFYLIETDLVKSLRKFSDVTIFGNDILEEKNILVELGLHSGHKTTDTKVDGSYRADDP
jgi:hypothetical protein